MQPELDNSRYDNGFNLSIVPPIVGIMLTGAVSLAGHAASGSDEDALVVLTGHGLKAAL